ncbi:diaminopimelate epimerase [Anthocerotibacter panamensis]|uniref:diaminopimelate epimerase n=1 Tax=Anthocerotibacter panamensis TaxID=2857077 RepID=UPI001C407BC8|nr:diaminopimelate epimerase [Anthocerotibacter panamensis]
MASLDFVKYHGLGNDFVLIDNRHCPQLLLTRQQVKAVCDRNRGIGADGVIFLHAHPDPELSAEMVIINSDGSEAQMCGNGIRCLARFMECLGIPSHEGTYPLWTKAGLIVPTLLPDGQVRVDMGKPLLLAAEIPTTLAAPGEHVLNVPLVVEGFTNPVTCVSMGNPHAIFFVQAVPEDWQQVGRRIELDPRFPERTNVHFVTVEDDHTLRVKVWERGAGPTLACGTGASAVLVAAVLTGQAKSPAQVWLPGGSLTITWTGDTVLMEGPAQLAFHGTLDVATFS